MRPVATKMRQEIGWRGAISALMLVLVVLLQACTSGNQPFGKDEATSPPKGRTVPPIELAAITGLPPGQAASLKEALTVSAARHDMAIVEGAFQSGNLSLSGMTSATAESGGSRVAYQWSLRDQDGVLLHQFAGEERAPGIGTDDPWSTVTPAVMQRIADATTRSIASKLAELGYATRLASIVLPPAEAFIAAGPGAQYDIDYETLYGPGAVDPALASAIAASSPPASGTSADRGGEAIPEILAEIDSRPARKAKGTEIKAVAVVPVEGSPGAGNGELTAAMRRTLRAAGWPVVKAPRGDALTIKGKVEMSEPTGSTQAVALRWTVSTPDGKTLGDVKQLNAVPSGSLDQGWGGNADAAVEAAALGIFDLIRRFR